MAPNETNNPSGGSDPTFQNNSSESQPPLSEEEAFIASVVSGLIPKFKEQASTTPMDTDDAAASGGEPSNNATEPAPLPREPQLVPKFLATQAQLNKAEAAEASGKKQTERRVRGMAQQNTTVNHFEPYARGVQYFVKYFLGGPDKPQDFPPPPSEREKDSQYWVERRAQFIMKQLDTLRDSLRDKPVAEQDYFVSRAESEIRKNIQPPPFTPASKKGDLRGSRPISLQMKSAVERELAAAGISRMTFDWTARPMDTSSWNTAVVEVMARKSVEWLSLSMKLSDQDAGQAQAIIQRWLQGKCREIQQYGNVDVNTYQAQKKVKLNKAQYTRWRKKICENRCTMASKLFPNNHQLAVVLADKDTHSEIEDGDKLGDRPVRVSPVWRADSLSTMLHGLDKMVISQATHHKTKSVNQDIYGQARSTFSKKKGINGVPRNLPVDCYNKAWREGLCKFDRDTVSETPAFSVLNLAKEIDKLTTLTPQPVAGPSGGSNNDTPGGQAGPSRERSMNLD
ncbi:hypothetical protein PTTG_28073 [Puccinia triticina 1-1 BBBD Race 1]|uniref:Uncharacterized protein n=1 Tax=Puccinia triticina (isolate 1-1 / race 1 (BBBD)) TaxID=630390 RepID=A0A180GEP0_PUCT1|nr:hypothetical protein PTTG_28073 [Puccinia triticina 1-1 BBBD Race 1]